MTSDIDSETRISIEREDETSTCVRLYLGDRDISRTWIKRFTLCIGEGRVLMDGIAGVGTDEEFRMKGLSRRVMQAALQHMLDGEAALSMLYGIRDFYPKFGYATAGPDHVVVLDGIEGGGGMPGGWSARDFREADLPALMAIYEKHASAGVGAAVRSRDCDPWSRLQPREASDGAPCRVVTDSNAQVRGYVWEAHWHWYVFLSLEREYPSSFIIGEALADNPLAARAVLAECRRLASEEARKREVIQTVLSLPPEGPLAAAAMHEDARFVQHYTRCGASMARVLDAGRLVRGLIPELSARLRAANSEFRGTLSIQSDAGTAVLDIGDGVCRVLEAGDAARKPDLTVNIPQADLARLALGAVPPEDLLATLPEPLPEGAATLLAPLFPLRRPHMYVPDRF